MTSGTGAAIQSATARWTGRDLKSWRRVLGMNQTEAAHALGRSRRSIVDYETGRRAIQDSLRRACEHIELEKRIEAGERPLERSEGLPSPI